MQSAAKLRFSKHIRMCHNQWMQTILQMSQTATTHSILRSSNEPPMLLNIANQTICSQMLICGNRCCQFIVLLLLLEMCQSLFIDTVNQDDLLLQVCPFELSSPMHCLLQHADVFDNVEREESRPTQCNRMSFFVFVAMD